MSDNSIQYTENEVFIMMEVQQIMRRFDVPLPQAIDILEKMTQMWKESMHENKQEVN